MSSNLSIACQKAFILECEDWLGMVCFMMRSAVCGIH